jgi:hypothetical protein
MQVMHEAVHLPWSGTYDTQQPAAGSAASTTCSWQQLLLELPGYFWLVR